jgi:hypothetical protein
MLFFPFIAQERLEGDDIAITGKEINGFFSFGVVLDHFSILDLLPGDVP